MGTHEMGTPCIQHGERGQEGGVDLRSSIPVAFSEPQRQLWTTVLRVSSPACTECTGLTGHTFN